MAYAITASSSSQNKGKCDLVKILAESLSDIYKYSINDEFRKEFRLALRLKDTDASKYTVQKSISDRLNLISAPINKVNEQQKQLAENDDENDDDFDALANVEF